MRFHHTQCLAVQCIARCRAGRYGRGPAIPLVNSGGPTTPVGLKARLLQLPALDIWTAFKKIDQSQVVYEEAVLRSRVSERNMQVSQNGRVYPSYGGNVDGTEPAQCRHPVGIRAV